MDGASKFVRGDAVAAMVIMAINLLGGLAIGMVQIHDNFGTAINTYSLLSVGDGLAAQLPALLISLSHRHHRDPSRHRVGPRHRPRSADPPPTPGRLRIAAAGVTLLALIPGLAQAPVHTRRCGVWLAGPPAD